MTRRGEAIRAELALVNEAIGHAEHEEPAEFSAMSLMVTGLLSHQERLLSELSEAEVGLLDVVFDGDAVRDHSLSVDVLAGTLGPLQEAVAAIAQDIEEEATTKGRISRSIRDLAMMRLTGTFEGSFGLRLQGPPPEVQLPLAPIDEETNPAALASVFEQAVDEVVETLHAAVDPEWEQALVETLADVPPRARTHLERLAQSVSLSGSVARFVWRKPDNPIRAVSIGPSQAGHLRQVLTALESEDRLVPVDGILVALDLIARTFAIQAPDETIYRAKASADLIAHLEERFNRRVSLILRATDTISALGQRRTTRYTLAQMR